MEPVGRHQGIAVQQYDITSVTGPQSGVGTGGKTEIDRVADQPDASRGGKVVQRATDLGTIFGGVRGVVHNDQAAGVGQGGQGRIDAIQCDVTAAMDRNDDIHRRTAGPTFCRDPGGKSGGNGHSRRNHLTL